MSLTFQVERLEWSRLSALGMVMMRQLHLSRKKLKLKPQFTNRPIAHGEAL